MPLSQVAHVERNLKAMAQLAPGLQVTESIILRVALILARDVSVRLERLLKPAGLTEPEYRVLAALFSQGGSAFPSELCAALAQSPANLTRVSDTLVQRGYVTRALHTTDRRKMVLTLKPAGERLLRSLLPLISANVAGAFQGFSAAEKKRLLADMKKLLAGVDSLCGGELESHDKVA
jgi:MarR family transcriptional repressor of emrRAB